MTAFWDYGFMRLALAAVLLIMPLFALLGTMVVNNGMSFFSDALGHSALTGVGLGVLLGCSRYEVPMLIFAVAFALLMEWVRQSGRSSADTVIGVFSSCGVALGLLLLSKGDGYRTAQSLLMGDILNITESDLLPLLLTLAAVTALWILCFNRFLAVSISPALAGSRRISAALYNRLFAVAVAVAVALAIRWVGLLLINAMLILPAAAARNVARSMRGYHLLSLLFALFSGVWGLIFSFYNALATGPTIVLCAALVFFGTYLIGKKR